MSQWFISCRNKGGILCLTLALCGCDRGKGTGVEAGIDASAASDAGPPTPTGSASAPEPAEPTGFVDMMKFEPGDASLRCEEAVVQPGRCVQELRHLRAPQLMVEWLAKHGVTDKNSVAIVENHAAWGCLEVELGEAREPALACHHLEQEPALADFPCGVQSSYFVDVIAVRGGKAVLAARAPFGLMTSEHPVLFSAPWKIDGPKKTIELTIDPEDCKAAPDRIAKFWKPLIAESTDQRSKDSMRSEQKMGTERVAKICRGPRTVAIK